MTIAELNREILSVVHSSTESEAEITNSTHLIKEMGLSSIEIMMLVFDLENTFGVDIPVSKLRHVQTVGDLGQLVSDRLRIK